jgi:hypothetical protein
LPIPEEKEEDLDMFGYIDQIRPRDIEIGKGKGVVTPDSRKQDRGNVWKRGLGFGRACFRGLGLR